MKNRLIYIISFLFFSMAILSAQDPETGIQGRIVDEQAKPVPFATVALFHAGDSTMAKAAYTEEDGRYTIQYLTPGSYYLNISFVGYDTYVSKILDVRSGEMTSVEPITLSPFATELGEVVVATTRPVVEVKPDKTVFNIEGSVNAIGNNALELLRKAPGVVVDNNERLMLIGKSGVRVYIDGKQSILRGDDLANFLRSLQSSQIESIEIITQPSSRYEAEGNAGIINIRLIKDKSLGTNATLSAGFSQGKKARSNVNLGINNRSSKLNLFGNLNFADGAGEENNNFERVTPFIHIDQENKGGHEYTNFSARAGADLTSGKFSTIGVLFDGYLNDFNYHNTIHTEIAPNINTPPTELLIGSSNTDSKRDNYNLNANYRFDNKNGTVLNFDVDYGSFGNESNMLQPNYYYDPETGLETDRRIFSSIAPTQIDITTAKADYERPLLGGILGAGLKWALVKSDNDFQFFNHPEGLPVPDVDRSNRFVYEENINAAYINFNKQWKKIGLQLGVRVEETDATGELTSLKPDHNETVTQDYTDFFPSGGLTWQVHQKHSLRLAYSRRIDRPNYQDLNPFEFKLDELTFQKGNPFLRPQFSNSYSLSHTFNYTLNTTISYSRTTDLMAELTDTADMRAAFLTTENIATQDLYSLNVSYPFSLSKSWNVFFNAGLTNTHNTADFGDGKIIDITATTFNFYGQNSYMLPKGFTLELSGWYRSPGIWGGNFASGEMWSVDAGIQKKIFQNRGTLKIGVDDIFFSQGWSGTNNLGGLAMSANGNWDSRRAKINFTYLFGNQEVQGSRRRSTGLEEQSKRIKQ